MEPSAASQGSPYRSVRGVAGPPGPPPRPAPIRAAAADPPHVPLTLRFPTWAFLFTGLELEHIGRAAEFVTGIGSAQHDPFASQAEASTKEVVQGVPVRTEAMRHDFCGLAAGQRRGSEIKALLKTTRGGGGIEDAIANGWPIGSGRGFCFHDAEHLAELSTAREKLTVERDAAGQLLGKPSRGEELVAVAREQFAAGPVTTYTVEFLAHQPAIDGMAHVHLGQHTAGAFGALL